MVALAVASWLALTGCATENQLAAKVIGASPAPDAGFLDSPEMMTPHPARDPFDRTWVSENLDWANYDQLYVAPVDTTHVLEQSLWDKVNVRQHAVQDDIQELGVEFRKRIVEAFRDEPKHHFQIVDDPNAIGERGAVLEVALVELVPNKAGLGLLGLAAWAAPLEVGVPVGTLAAFANRGSVAFELRVRDAPTRDVIAMAADREAGAMRVIDLRSVTWYGNVHEIFGQWAQAMVELTDTPSSEQVEHSPYFTLLPW
jgi:hypothetical protein